MPKLVEGGLSLSLVMYLAQQLIDQKLQEHACTHLFTRIERDSLYIYSIEQGEEAYRAALTLCGANQFAVSLTDPKGYWQPTEYRGSIAEMAAELTSTFAFALTRWQS